MSSGHILLVDDVQESRAVLSLILQSAGYDVTEVSSGQELLDLPTGSQEQFDLVLLDVRMPDIDGYTLCGEIKNRSDNLPVIFLSALHNASDKIRGLEAGAVDFIEKGFDRHELLARINVQLTLSRLHKQLAEALAASKERERQLEEDLEAAAAVQSVILAPRELEIAGIDASSHHLAHSKITGDTYNIVPLSANHIAAYLLDVSGHGTPAALIAASLANSLQPHTDYLRPKSRNAKEIIEPISPTQVLTRLDKEYPIDRFGRYFTMVYSVLDIKTGNFCYANAGHPEPILHRTTGEIVPLETGGPIMGVAYNLPFPQETITLDRGDTIILYSDGVTDFVNARGERYEAERFFNLIARAAPKGPSKLVETIFSALLEFSGGAPLADDVSVLALTYRGT